MISVTTILVVVSFGLSFLAFRKKKLSVRFTAGALLAAVLVGIFIGFILMGGDPAQAGAVSYKPEKRKPGRTSRQRQRRELSRLVQSHESRHLPACLTFNVGQKDKL